MHRKTYLIVLVFLMFGLAFWQVGLAKEKPDSNSQSSFYDGERTLNFDDDEPGSVKPPSGKSVISSPGRYSIGGVCVLTVKALSPNVTVSTKLIGLDNIGRLPEDWRFLAGICRVTFSVKATPVSQVTTSQALVEICFATIPNAGGLTRVQTGKNDWTTLGTVAQKGETCSPVTISGNYLYAGGN